MAARRGSHCADTANATNLKMAGGAARVGIVGLVLVVFAGACGVGVGYIVYTMHFFSRDTAYHGGAGAGIVLFTGGKCERSHERPGTYNEFQRFHDLSFLVNG